VPQLAAPVRFGPQLFYAWRHHASLRNSANRLICCGFFSLALAIPAGFEPATHGVEIRYSIQLSYGTVLGGTRLDARLGLSSTANMKNPLSRQDGRTDFLKLATKADGGPLCSVRP
jgi:hypothetical protein